MGCLLSAERYRGPVTDHFDGERFRNARHTPHAGPVDLWRWQATRDRGPWGPRRDASPGPPPPARVGAGELRVTWIGHATVLVQMDGVNVLTDPVWSERVSPIPWIGPSRVRPPGVRFEDLPPIDAVLISHNHYDHMDLPTLRRIAEGHRPRFLTGLGNGAFLRSRGIERADAYDWWQATEIGPGVWAHFVPARHFSMRGLCDRDGTLWGGFVVRGPAGAVYFAGDTGDGPHFEEIGRRFGPLRLALVPIGAFRPEWFMRHIHTGPRDALRAQQALSASTAVGIHFGTFPLADDGEDEPATVLRAELAEMPEPRPRFWILEVGQGRDVPLP